MGLRKIFNISSNENLLKCQEFCGHMEDGWISIKRNTSLQNPSKDGGFDSPCLHAIELPSLFAIEDRKNNKLCGKLYLQVNET